MKLEGLSFFLKMVFKEKEQILDQQLKNEHCPHD